MARLPGRMYTRITGPSYTRKKYMGGIPNLRIAQFETGNLTADFPVIYTLVAKERCHIRHTSLEAARIVANKYLNKNAGNIGYMLKIRVFPHQVLRQNKQASGAGADRISQGMRRAFGKAISLAARIEPDQKVITVKTTEGKDAIAKEALRKAGSKLPTPFYIIKE